MAKSTPGPSEKKKSMELLPDPIWAQILEFANAAAVLAVERVSQQGRRSAWNLLRGVLATTCLDSEAELWDFKTGVRLGTLAAEGEKFAICCEYARQGRSLVGIGKDGVPRIWCGKTGALARELRVPAARDCVDDCVDGDKTIIGGCHASDRWITAIDMGGRRAHFFDTRTGELRHTVYPVGRPEVFFLDVAVAYDGRVATLTPGHACWDHIVRIHEPLDSGCALALRIDMPLDEVLYDADDLDADPEDENTLPYLCTCVFARDARSLLLAGAYCRPSIWSASTGRLLATLDVPSSSDGCCEFSTDGRRVVATAFEKAVISICDAQTGACLFQIKETAHTSVGPLGNMRAIFSDDGRCVVAACTPAKRAAAGWISVWDSRTGTRIRRIDLTGQVWGCDLWQPAATSEHPDKKKHLL